MSQYLNNDVVLETHFANEDMGINDFSDVVNLAGDKRVFTNSV